jgi:hypothetical protein
MKSKSITVKKGLTEDSERDPAFWLRVPLEQVIEARDCLRLDYTNSRFTYNYDTIAALKIPDQPPNFQRIIGVKKFMFFHSDPENPGVAVPVNGVYMHASFAKNTRGNYVARSDIYPYTWEKKYILDSGTTYEIFFTRDGYNQLISDFNNPPFDPMNPPKPYFYYGYNFIIELVFY